MGLDMYLDKRKYLSEFNEEDKSTQGTISRKLKLGKYEVPKYVECEVAYWRKANAIHRWFVENVQQNKDDCEEYYVSTENLKTLLRDVEAVLADETKAEQLLPSSRGFFFGSIDYDEYYISDMKYTRTVLKRIIKKMEADTGWEYYYRASW